MLRKAKTWLVSHFRKSRPDRLQAKDFSPEPLNPISETTRPALELLMDSLVEETVGSGGVLDQSFHSILSAYNAETNPIDRRQAELLLSSLIRTAVSNRKLLNERIIRSIESGELHHQYYDRIHAVSALAVDAYSKMRVMELSREEYLFHRNVYEKVRRSSSREDKHPGEDEIPQTPEPDKDLFRAIDQAAGQGADEENGGYPA